MKPDCTNCHEGNCYHIEESKEIAREEAMFFELERRNNLV
jgi:hypothetical protein